MIHSLLSPWLIGLIQSEDVSTISASSFLHPGSVQALRHGGWLIQDGQGGEASGASRQEPQTKKPET